MLRPPVHRQIGQDPPDDRGELVAVPAADGDGDVAPLGQRVEHEVAVGREGVEAGPGVDAPDPSAGGSRRSRNRTTRSNAASSRSKVRVSAVTGLLPPASCADLGPRLAEDGEAVVAGVVHPDPDREALGPEIVRAGRGEVGDLLLGDPEREMDAERRQRLVAPRAGRDHQPAAAVGPAAGRTSISPPSGRMPSTGARSSRVAPWARARRWWAALPRAAIAIPPSAW